MQPKKQRRRVSACRRMGRTAATEANEGWSMDFMSDELYDGRRIRLLTLVDNFTRESLAIEVNDHLGGHRVVEVLQRLRDECLNENWFLSLEDARDKVRAWREEYNRWRPHSALCNLSPEEFIRMKELVG